MKTYALTVTCPSQRGIVAAIANYIAETGCNITDSAQFDDRETGNFFMRISFNSETGTTLEQLSEGFGERGRSYFCGGGLLAWPFAPERDEVHRSLGSACFSLGELY